MNNPNPNMSTFETLLTYIFLRSHFLDFLLQEQTKLMFYYKLKEFFGLKNYPIVRFGVDPKTGRYLNKRRKMVFPKNEVPEEVRGTKHFHAMVLSYEPPDFEKHEVPYTWEPVILPDDDEKDKSDYGPIFQPEINRYLMKKDGKDYVAYQTEYGWRSPNHWVLIPPSIPLVFDKTKKCFVVVV